MKVLKFLDEHLEEFAMVLLLSCIVVVMLLQIIFRYVLNNSLSWSEEFCRYCYIWLMFLAFSYSIRLDADLRIDVIVNMMPAGIKKCIEFIVLVFSLVLTGYLFVNSFGTVGAVIKTGETSVSLHLPMMYVYAASVVGYGLGTVRYIQKLFQTLMPGKKDEKEGPEA